MADRAVGIPFAKEGIPFIGTAVGVTLLAIWLGWVVVVIGAALLTLFVSWFFRNPSRVVPQGARLVVASGDGKVVAIEEEFEPRFIKERRYASQVGRIDGDDRRSVCLGANTGASAGTGARIAGDLQVGR